MKTTLHSSLPRIPFTKLAYEKIQKDTQRLHTEREETLERLKVAREQGDLSENGAYRYAKMELGNIGRQLRQLHYLLRFGHVVQSSEKTNVVGFGNTVTLSTNGKEVSYMIVSEHEADPKNGKLSTESPIGKALLGKKIGDTVVVSAPARELNYTITKIT